MITVHADCIVPTVFRADVECYGYHEWCVVAPDDFEKGLCSQMHLLCDEVKKQTQHRLQLRPQLKVLGDEHVVRSIKKGTASRIYRIEDSWLDDVAPKLQGKPNVFYIWIPFKRKIFHDLSKAKRAPRQDGNRFWFPCLESKERNRRKLRKALAEELMHWIKETLAERSCECLGRTVRLPSPDNDKQCFWRQLNRVLDSEDPEAIGCLFGLPPARKA